MNKDQTKDQLRAAALYYHRQPKPGKIAVTPTKQLTNQYDLSMAYSPGLQPPARRSLPIRPRSAR